MGKFTTCCCCLIYLDEFDRADASTLGGYWCESPGSWEIYSGTARVVTAGANAILNYPHPVPDESMWVIGRTINESVGSGQKYRLILNAVPTITSGVCSTNNFYFADFIRVNDNDGTSKIKLGICSGGTETILKEDTVMGLTGTSRNFQALIGKNPNEFCANVSEAVLSFVGTNHAGVFANGYYSGMALSHAGMQYDRFSFYQHYTTNNTCLNCICKCDDNLLPPELTCKIYPDPACNTAGIKRLDKLENPCEFKLLWTRVTARWEGETLCCAGGQVFRIITSCPTTNVDGPDCLNLSIVRGAGCFSSCGTCEPGIVSCTCSPFKVTFGPYLVSTFDFTCSACSTGSPPGWSFCNFYIEISA
jgi:hypothetical protein